MTDMPMMKGTEGSEDYLVLAQSKDGQYVMGVKPLVRVFKGGTLLGLRLRVAPVSSLGAEEAEDTDTDKMRKAFGPIEFHYVDKTRASLVLSMSTVQLPADPGMKPWLRKAVGEKFIEWLNNHVGSGQWVTQPIDAAEWLIGHFDEKFKQYVKTMGIVSKLSTQTDPFSGIPQALKPPASNKLN